MATDKNWPNRRMTNDEIQALYLEHGIGTSDEDKARLKEIEDRAQAIQTKAMQALRAFFAFEQNRDYNTMTLQIASNIPDLLNISFTELTVEKWEQIKKHCEQIQEKLNKHSICPVFNVLTRASLEDRWESVKQTSGLAIAFLDVDKLKEANSRWGQYESSKRLAEAFALARHDEIIGRFYLGDELIIIAPIHEINHPVERIMKALVEREMSATVAIAPYRGQESLKDAAKEVNEKVEELKAQNQRGVVVWI